MQGEDESLAGEEGDEFFLGIGYEWELDGQERVMLASETGGRDSKE